MPKANSTSKQKRIVWVEDSADIRFTLGDMFRIGFTREGVSYEERANFDSTLNEIRTGDLASVYILDNEIAGKQELGIDIAQKIHEKALQEKKDVLIITLLCSSPEEVVSKYRDQLKDKHIAVLHKLTHAPLVGFWVGDCIASERKLTLEEWIKKTDTHLVSEPRLFHERSEVQTALSLSILDGNHQGAFYQHPRDYIDAHMNTIKTYLNYPGSLELMNQTFPPIARKRIEHK